MKKIIVVLLLIGAGLFTRQLFQNSPQYTLKQIQTAYHNHDVEAFKRYVDVPAVSASMFDALAVDSNQPFSGLANGLVGLFRGKLEKELSDQIIKLVEIGSEEEFNGGPISNLLKHNLDLVFAEDESVVKVDFVEIKKEGKIAFVELDFHLVQFDTSITRSLKMRELEDRWQLFDVSDALDVPVLHMKLKTNP